MKLVGLMLARNEEWCLAFTARVALQWCDSLVILNHCSEDRTPEIIYGLLDEFQDRIITACENDPVWHEMELRQEMLRLARANGATHIALIDADEFLSANLIPGIRDYVEGLQFNQLLELPGYNLRGSLTRYHSNGIWGNRWFSTAFRDCPEAQWAGDNFHQRAPLRVNWKTWRPIKQGQGGTLHLWGVEERRLRAKHAMYKITERLRWPNKPDEEIDRYYSLWRSPEDAAKIYGKHHEFSQPWEFATAPKEWLPYATVEAMDEHLHLAEEPWQEAEVRRLVAEHGREKFAGLDLFGVA